MSLDGTATKDGRAELAGRIMAALGLEAPPVALAFVEVAPEGVPSFEGVAPSACSFWRAAEGGSFFASASQHANCAVGSHVMGFPADSSSMAALQAAVETMGACGYLAADEAGRIPTVRRQASGVVYGPLADFPLPADLVLCWLQPSQAMLLQEAAGEADWTNAARRSLFGRPGCAALPLALGDAKATLSAGCTGMRAFTEVSGDRMLAVLPGADLERTAGRLEATRQANEAMAAYYDERRRAVEAEAATGV